MSGSQFSFLEVEFVEQFEAAEKGSATRCQTRGRQ